MLAPHPRMTHQWSLPPEQKPDAPGEPAFGAFVMLAAGRCSGGTGARPLRLLAMARFSCRCSAGERGDGPSGDGGSGDFGDLAKTYVEVGEERGSTTERAGTGPIGEDGGDGEADASCILRATAV